MEPIVSIIMGSTSDLPVMEKAAKLLDEMHVPFEMNALSAHRTPEAVEEFAKNAAGRGIKVIIAAAGMAAALPGVIAANTTLPVIGVPVKGSVLDGVDALYSIIQMPPGIPVATVAIDGVEPTLDNTYSGKYPVWTYEHMYTKGTPNETTQKFLDYIMSDEYGKKMESLGYGVSSKMQVKEH